MKVFSKGKYIKRMGIDNYNLSKRTTNWVDKCDGKQVKDGKCGGFCIADTWCIDVPEPVNCRCVMKPVSQQKHAPEPYNRYKITIECDGTNTTARMYVDGHEVKHAHAKRNPADKFSWRVGAETAFGRLWSNSEKKKPADGVREVKRVAKVGEWVKIVNKFGYIAEKYKNGDIRKVCKLFDEKGWVYLEGEMCATAPDEYVVLEGYKPGNEGKEEKQERPFKVGDRVVCVEATDGNDLTVGKHGRIIHIVDSSVDVEFDEKINGHSSGGRGKDWYCWCCWKKTLRHE